MRLSSPALKKALFNGITDEGVNVKDIGLVPIDAIYFAVGKLGDEAGIMITATHNPKEYNGFKMVLKGMEFDKWAQKCLKKLKNYLKEISETKGEVKEEDII